MKNDLPSLSNESEVKHEEIKILRLGKVFGSVEWFDFEQVPQGYIKICGTGVPKPKGLRKNLAVNGTLINPTDQQVIEYARKLNSRSPDYNPNNKYIITNEDFRK